MNRPWIGVDLDGTLAHYEDWGGVEHIGEPIPEMTRRVKGWLAEGRYDVRIFTARVSGRDEQETAVARLAIAVWCEEHLGQRLEVTCVKDRHMVALYDDRAVGVEHNTGRLVGRGRIVV